MAVVTPAVYQALARRGLGPPLKPPVEPTRLPWRFQASLALLRRNFPPALRPQSVNRFAAEGGAGVPLFGDDELRAFVSEADEAPADHPRHGHWWEFWPTRDGSYAMFPGDDTKRPSVASTLWIPAGRSAQVRRVELSALLGLGDPRSGDRPLVPPEACALLADEAEPGAPYVGRCKNAGCDSGCSPHIVVHPDDGIYRLLGCAC